MFIDTNPFDILHLDLMQRPIGWDLQPNLQLMLVHGIRSSHLVRRRRHLDLEVLVDKFRSRLCALGVRQLGSDNHGRKVRGGVAGDGRRYLSFFAIEHPVVDQRWNRQ